MSNINIGIPIDLQKLLVSRLLVQAGSGGGKSYTLRKVIESIGKQVQQIVIDPEGEFATLREKFDFALVSKGGDIPLTVKYAETLAHKILETGISVIIDLYELPRQERILFVKRFLHAVINAPKSLWHDCFIHIDEADIFCPEGSQSESTSAVIDLCTRGRKRGFAAVLATSRMSKLNKDATAECNNKLIGRSAQDIDRKRAGDELGMTAKTDILAIRNLQPGEFYAFGPAISLDILKFRVTPVLTTHLEAGRRMASPPPTPAAIQKILTKLSDIPEEAERELQTKQQFQAEISRLKNELSKSVKSVPAPASNDRQIAQAREDMRKHYAAVLKERDAIILSAHNQVKKLQGVLAKIAALSGGQPTELPSVPVSAEIKSPVVKEQKQQPAQKIQISDGGTPLGKCGRAIISFLAGYADREWSKAQVAVVTGYSVASGGFNNALADLNSRGLIIRGGKIKVNPAALPVIEGLIGEIRPMDYNVESFKDNLGKCEREIYEVLLESPHDIYSKESLAAATPSNYSHGSGGFNNSLSRLTTLELISRDNGKIKLNPELLELL